MVFDMSKCQIQMSGFHEIGKGPTVPLIFFLTPLICTELLAILCHIFCVASISFSKFCSSDSPEATRYARILEVPAAVTGKAVRLLY